MKRPSQARRGDFKHGACYHLQLNASTLGRPRSLRENTKRETKKPNKNVKLKVYQSRAEQSRSEKPNSITNWTVSSSCRRRATTQADGGVVGEGFLERRLMASESQVPRSLRNWIFKSRRKSKKRQIEKGWTPSGRMKYAKRSARTRHRKCEWKLCIMPAKTKLLRNLFSVFSYFFFIFQFCVTKMKLLSNFATLRYFFSVLFSLRACAMRERLLELNLKLYYFCCCCCCCYCFPHSQFFAPKVGEVIAIRFTALIWLCLCNYHNFLCNCKLTC